MELTEQKIKDLIEIQKERGNLLDSDWNDYHWRNIKRLQALLKFVESGVKFKCNMSSYGGHLSMDGTVLVEDKFVFALLSNKWKVVGKNVWYRSSGPVGFINKFVKEKSHE